MAINRERMSTEKSAVADFYRSIKKQRPAQYQGIYVIDPDGKVLSNQAKPPDDEKDWARDLRAVIDRGVRAYGQVTRRPPTKFTALADRGEGTRDDGSIVLAVYARYLLLGLDKRGFGDPAYDSIVLTSTQQKYLAMRNCETGMTWTVPWSLASQLHKVLSPNSDPNTMARADEVTRARLEVKVERVRKGVAYLRFAGRISGVHVWEFGSHKGKKIHADMGLAGTGTCDAKTGELISITLVGDGEFINYPPYDQRQRYGAVIEWHRGRVQNAK